MNARNSDHYLGFWTGLLNFTEHPSKGPTAAKVARAKATLRRLAKRPQTGR
jgi:hypothetical protein